MPEGPTIVILCEAASRFRGKTIRHATGAARVDLSRLQGKRVKAVRTWGKHFLFEFAGFSVRVHLLLFGSYRIDDPKDAVPRMTLVFDNGRLDFYASDVRFIEGSLDDVYDWTADVLSDDWCAAAARKKLRAMPDTLVCDALLNQEIFAGVGNIIKNEVLFRTRLCPDSRLGAIPAKKRKAMIDDARAFSLQFLKWRRGGVLKKNCQVHNKSICPRCAIPLQLRVLGKTHRRAFFCTKCQIRYGGQVEKPQTMRLRSMDKLAVKPPRSRVAKTR